MKRASGRKFAPGELSHLQAGQRVETRQTGCWPASDRGGHHVTDSGPDIGPYAKAIEWVAKITTVGLMMTLPVVAGRYFDQRWGTNYWVLVGLAAGVTTGMWQLVQMTRP